MSRNFFHTFAFLTKRQFCTGKFLSWAEVCTITQCYHKHLKIFLLLCSCNITLLLQVSLFLTFHLCRYYLSLKVFYLCFLVITCSIFIKMYDASTLFLLPLFLLFRSEQHNTNNLIFSLISPTLCFLPSPNNV